MLLEFDNRVGILNANFGIWISWSPLPCYYNLGREPHHMRRITVQLVSSLTNQDLTKKRKYFVFSKAVISEAV